MPEETGLTIVITTPVLFRIRILHEKDIIISRPLIADVCNGKRYET